MEDNQVAAELRIRLAETIGQERFELWFGAGTQWRLDQKSLTIVVSNNFTRDWLRRNFSGELRAVCRAVMGCELSIDFGIDEKLSVPAPSNVKPPLPKPAEVPKAVSKLLAGETAQSPQPAAIGRLGGAGRNGRKAEPLVGRTEPKLAELVVGTGNEYAMRAAEVTARGLQQASPVVFCGPTGVGKTHLLRAIRAEYRHSHPRARAVYLTAEQFITSFVEALRGSGLPSFRQKCRGADLLILDDIQFFAGKRASLDELLHTFDVLLAEGRQIVLGSDRSLAELQSLGKELVSRVASGLVCNIQPPDFAMRLEIVGRLSRELGLALDAEVIGLVATQISAGARELRGALHRLQATTLAYDEPISQQMAFNALSDLAQQCTQHVRLADVEQAICNVFGVEAVQLRSDRKSRSIHEPRMLAMWLARKYTRAPWSEIGEFFGRRSHSTVISAHHRVEKLIRSRAVIGVSHETCGVEEAIRRVEAAIRSA